MLSQTGVGLLVALQLLLLTAFHATVHQFASTILILILTLYHEEVLIVGDDLRVDGIVSTLAERQEIHGIEEIRLSHAILPQQAVHLRREFYVGREDVLVIDDGNILEYHG